MEIKEGKNYPKGDISNLDLSLRIERSLYRNGIFNISDLSSMSRDKMLRLRNVGKKTVDEIEYALAHKNYEMVNNVISEKIESVSFHNDLSRILSDLNFDNKKWEIFNGRFILRKTYQDIAESIGVTRERIRQICLLLKKIRISRISSALDILEEEHEFLSDPLIDDLIEDQYSRAEYEIEFIFRYHGWNISSQDAFKLLLIIRGYVELHKDKESFLVKTWPEISYIACALPYPIKSHNKVGQLIESQIKAKINWTYTDLAIEVLIQEQKPLHWSKIVEHAEKLGRRNSFNASAIYNALIAKKNTFVRVKAGTYGLKNWGLSTVENFTDIISSIMKREGYALHKEVIYAQANKVRKIKESTLIMSLDLNPRFYRSIESTYGLRAWLLKPEDQTLRTPRWLIEDTKSFQRVINASTRGYNIEAIIEKDKK